MEILFCFPSALPPNFEAGRAALEKGGMVADRVVSYAELKARLGAEDVGLVCVLSGFDRAELGQAIQTAQALRERLGAGATRILMAVKNADPKLLALLRKQGVSEVIESTAATKELLFKVKKSVQVIQTALDKRKAQGSSGRAGSDRGVGAGREATRKGGDAKVEWVPELALASDTWLILDKAQVRSVMGRWLIEVVGPGPAAGGWHQPDAGKNVWVWKPRDPGNDPFTSTGMGDRGLWHFEGRQPEFIWATNRWRMVSQAPSLGFLRQGQPPVYRFRFEPGVFRVAENSSAALGKRDAITATFEASLRLKNEAKKPQTAEDLRFAEEAAKAGLSGTFSKDDESKPDWNSDISPDAEAKGWGAGDLSPEDAAKGLSGRISADKAREGSLNGSVSPDKAREGSLNGSVSPDKAPSGEFEGNISADPAAAEWGGLDTGRGNRFEGGGIGMGEKSAANQGYGYDKDGRGAENGEGVAFKSGDAAFEKLACRLVWIRRDGSESEAKLLERDDASVFVELPVAPHSSGERLVFQLKLSDGQKTVELDFYALFSGLDGASGGTEVVKADIPEQSRKAVDLVFKAYAHWQSEAFRFLDAARGFGV